MPEMVLSRPKPEGTVRRRRHKTVVCWAKEYALDGVLVPLELHYQILRNGVKHL